MTFHITELRWKSGKSTLDLSRSILIAILTCVSYSKTVNLVCPRGVTTSLISKGRWFDSGLREA